MTTQPLQSPDLATELGVDPTALKTHVRDFYGSLNQFLKSSELDRFVHFFNWGYESLPDLPDEATSLIPAGMIDRHAIKLVLEVIGTLHMDGQDVLDVGCGRGGTLATLATRFEPRSLTGIDLTPESIDHCRRTHTTPLMQFFQGDAENLPFGDENFDRVTNVESSNAYPHMDRFYREVARVLRIDGVFLYTDLLRVEQFDFARNFFKKMGFSLEHDRNITRNVLEARRLTAQTQLRAFGNQENGSHDSVKDTVMHHFLAPAGSAFFKNIEDGQFEYRILRFRKNARYVEL